MNDANLPPLSSLFLQIGALAGGAEAHGLGIYSCSWSPDSKKVVTVSADKTAKIWDDNGNLLQYVPLYLPLPPFSSPSSSIFYCTIRNQLCVDSIQQEGSYPLLFLSLRQRDVLFPRGVVKCFAFADDIFSFPFLYRPLALPAFTYLFIYSNLHAGPLPSREE